MNVPGAGPEQQAGLDVLARSFKLGREGVEQSAAWGNRLGRETQAIERERTRQEERQRLGLPPERPPEQQSESVDLANRRGRGRGEGEELRPGYFEHSIASNTAASSPGFHSERAIDSWPLMLGLRA
jgi:hypothetical protein